MMGALLLMLQNSPVVGGFSGAWEIGKGVMLTLTTAGVLWIARSTFFLRDDVRDLAHDVRGRDGDNGIKSSLRKLVDRTDALEGRNERLDAIKAYEKEQYAGEDRRESERRLLDKVRAEIDPIVSAIKTPITRGSDND